ncbi:MAG: hypothetical protein IJ220_06070 [Clostridia bacterium]|nr:hypothetical protein [Clostridia bacterium]
MMLHFVNRLSTQQIMDFFYGIGGLIDMKPSASEGMKDIFFEDKNGKIFWYSISDNYISAYGFHKTSEDWKFYLLNLFGEEYMNEYAEVPVGNSFISKLTKTDIQELVELSHVLVEDVEEERSFRKGTRRFKVSIKLPICYEKEIIIGPHLEYCNGIPSITEKMFIGFFVKKFGMDFINYYIEVEKKACSKKVEDYRIRCENRVKEKLSYMVKTWENNERSC